MIKGIAWEHYLIRSAAYNKFYELGMVEDPVNAPIALLSLLLRGVSDADAFVGNVILTDEEVRLCRMLAGPHCRAVCKMLLAQRTGVDDGTE